MLFTQKNLLAFSKKTSSMQVWVVLNYTSRNVIKLYV